MHFLNTVLQNFLKSYSSLDSIGLLNNISRLCSTLIDYIFFNMEKYFSPILMINTYLCFVIVFFLEGRGKGGHPVNKPLLFQ